MVRSVLHGATSLSTAMTPAMRTVLNLREISKLVHRSRWRSVTP